MEIQAWLITLQYLQQRMKQLHLQMEIWLWVISKMKIIYPGFLIILKIHLVVLENISTSSWIQRTEINLVIFLKNGAKFWSVYDDRYIYILILIHFWIDIWYWLFSNWYLLVFKYFEHRTIKYMVLFWSSKRHDKILNILAFSNRWKKK